MTTETSDTPAQAIVPAPGSLDELWKLAQDELKFNITRQGYEMWLAKAQLLESDGDKHYTLGVQTPFARTWVTEHFLPLITETLQALTGKDCKVTIEVAGNAQPPEEEVPVPLETAVPLPEPELTPDARLNPNFTFSTFVVGNSTRFAHAASRAVADTPGQVYNPLFIYGGVGLGKTHLMHAIGHGVRESRRATRVAYVTSEQFMNDFISAIRENRTSDFRNRYRNVDVLLIDDIQFLAGKDRSQEEFFHTYNTLHDLRKQIVISSDRPPKEIPALEDRLRSRFEGGLMADLQPPDFETRLAIINSKLGSHAALVPEDVCQFIAHRIHSNIRELEGALLRVLAHASIYGRPLSVEEVQKELGDLLPPDGPQHLTVSLVQDTVADHYHITVEELNSKSRYRHIVFPRQVAMYLIREEMGTALSAIGEAFGGMDHTTVLHSCERITELVQEDARLQHDLKQIRHRLASA